MPPVQKIFLLIFFFQAEDGIRDKLVTGVQTCALPILPVRAIEAAKLYREGYAPEVWLTHSTEPAETLGEMGIPFTGEDHYNALILIHEGVPARAIHVLEPPIVNTADEIKVAASALARAKGDVVILV